MSLKIAVVVQGRFHAFDLTRALIARGHDVTLFTNYPKWAVKRFGIPKKHVQSFWLHGILVRVALKINGWGLVPFPEAWLHRLFGLWAANRLRHKAWDMIRCWSGVSEELLDTTGGTQTVRVLTRGSAHIRAQANLLEDEQKRTGFPQERPSLWITAREEREYAKADYIVVLSDFAYQTFIEQGVPAKKLKKSPLGVEVEAFRPDAEVVDARCQRILKGAPLRVLYVGTLSFRKGMWDLDKAIRELHCENFQFRLVGSYAPEAQKLVEALEPHAKIIPRQPQHRLPQQYDWADLFLFPTIEDGFAAVLAQATANALPILTTTNCSGPDFIREGQTGWIVPVQSPDMIIERLRWCNGHRQEVAAMVRRIYGAFKPRSWIDVAADFEAIAQDHFKHLSVREA